MPRAGAGSGGGHHSVSSHRSSSHMTTSHRVGSSRPKSSTSSSFSRPSRPKSTPIHTTPSYSRPKPPTHSEPARIPTTPPIIHTPPRPSRPTHQTIIVNNSTYDHPSYKQSPNRSYHTERAYTKPSYIQPKSPKKQNHTFRNIMLAITAILLVCSMILIFGKQDVVPESTSQRVKLSTGMEFQNDCIIDELNWFDNIPKTEKRLQNFYNQTGIQPYIVLKQYDPELTTDEEKEAYANDWYDEHIDNQSTFLFMYFGEQDADNDVGLMTSVNGKQITSVMDAEAIDIFWNYMDEYWYSDSSTDDLFVNTFDKTAARIMKVTTTTNDVLRTIVISLTVTSTLILLYLLVKEKFRRDKEKAEETERILNTPLETTSTTDDLVNKYTEKGE